MEPTLHPPRTIPPASAEAYGLGAAIIFLSGRPLAAAFGLFGNAALQWVALFGVVALGALVLRVPLSDAVGFKRVRSRALLGAALLMLGALPLNGVVAWLQSFVMDPPVEVATRFVELLSASSPLMWLGLMFAVTLTPAICEEVVYRGVLMHPFRDRAPGWLVIALSSLAFGAMHWMPETAFRILPAAFSGAVIGWAVWVTGSLWTGIVMHAVNNGVLITAAAIAPDAIPERADLTPPLLGVILGLGLVALGGRLVLVTTGDEGTSSKSSPRAAPPPPPTDSDHD